MRVVVDRYIPYLAEALMPFADVVALEPDAITAETAHDADALFVRTRTKVNAALLAHSKVQFVGTATIGYDHIDTDFCTTHHIAWTACPGCNAQAVCDYVEEAIYEAVAPKTPLVLGIIGVGHVGSLVMDMAQKKGWTVLINDAPKSLGVSLEEMAQKCDVITFHSPLTFTGLFPTYHLCDATFIHQCQPHAVIINAARGGVVDEQAILGSKHPYIADCWENEPYINHALLQSPHTLLASYHIAGYSLQGKRNASNMCLQAFCQHFHLPPITLPEANEEVGDSAPGWLTRITNQLRNNPGAFESLRKQYKLR